MEAWAVVVAAGSGTRFGAPKQFADLAGRPVLEWSLETARKACAGVVLVLPPERADQASPSWDADAVVAGGATRSASVRAGLEAVPGRAEVVAVHDAARPLAPLELWRAVIEAVAAGADAAIPASPVTDTVKEVGEGGHLVTLDRSRLVAVQTPQAFRAEVIRQVHRVEAEATDDAALVEAGGGTVELVPAPAHNLKITSPVDLVIAAALLEVGA
ncbi:MAG TPA: 2-C-methyl-D-erythritol 4-phosphate cytidylyltransferase [Acidimicrobiales bacterium]|nr:2-C-methyl-D-erythritol 4-phosphate cytidylyltransferase [Acidimicrobiales bacterium]